MKPDTSILLCTSEDDEIPADRWAACVAAAKAHRPAQWAAFWRSMAEAQMEREAAARAAAEQDAAA